MDVATIICEYIYGAFKIIKTSIDALVEVYELTIEKLYSIATTINNVIFGTLGKGLEAILVTVTTVLNSLIAALNIQVGGSWKFCTNAYRCKFFLEQVLNPDSLIAQAIRKIASAKDDCYCKQQTEDTAYSIQQTLYDIVYDYENFKTQICNGLSLDLANDMLIDLATGYLGTLNRWRRKIELKIRMLRKKLLNLLDMYRASGLFDLLRQLEAFFDCVIDSELCANVDTAKSYYNSVLAKLKLRKVHRTDKTGVEAVEEFAFSPEFEDQIVGTANSFLATVKAAIKKVQSVLELSSCSYSTRGASNALDLTTSVVGICKAVKDGDPNKIPIVDYTNRKVTEIMDAFRECHQKTTDDSSLALSSNKCYTLDDAMLGTQATGLYEECLLVRPGTDTSHAQEILQVGDKFYTVADAARQLYTGKGDNELLNYCRTVGNILNIKNIMTRY